MPDDPDDNDTQLPSDVGPADGPSLFDTVSKGIRDAIGEGADPGPPELDREIDPNWAPNDDELKDMDDSSKDLPSPDAYPNTNDGDPLPAKDEESSTSDGDQGAGDGGSGGDGSSGGEDGGGGDGGDGGGG